jgi:Uma2 family endonuclease
MLTVHHDRIRPLRRIEYDVLVERGLLADARVELLAGALVEMSPQGPVHATVVARLARHFIRGLPDEVDVRVQSPFAAADDSEPEPDIAVVPAGDYTKAHPDRAVLIIEVAESSLVKDRGLKAALYATAGVPEFWLVNLVERVVEVHRRPVSGRYEDITRRRAGDVLAPEAFPSATIEAAAVLPT